MMVMKGEVLVVAVVLGPVLIVRIVQRDERSEIEVLGRGLVFHEVHEEERYPHQVRADQESLHPKDGQ